MVVVQKRKFLHLSTTDSGYKIFGTTTLLGIPVYFIKNVFVNSPYIVITILPNLIILRQEHIKIKIIQGSWKTIRYSDTGNL